MSLYNNEPEDQLQESAIGQQTHDRTLSAKQDAAAAAQRGNQETETGTNADESTAAILNKLRGGMDKTEASLKILGAGAPYKPGDY